MKSLFGLAVALIVVMPSVALAQPPRPPAVEVGTQFSELVDDPAPYAWSSRLTVNLTPRTAIEGTADIQRSLKLAGVTRISVRDFSAHWRQTVFTSGRWQIFGVLGAGTVRVEDNFFPEGFVFSRSGFVAHLGPAVQVELAPWLALRGDLRLTLGSVDSGGRAMVGAVIPIGRFRAGEPPVESTPPPAGWHGVRPGREVWVTTNTGSLVHGEIAAISGSTLTLREQDREVRIRLDDVRLVQGRDSLKNGFIIGAVPGAVGGGLVLGALFSAICGSENCDLSVPVAVLIGAAGGGAVGGIIGVIVDGLISGRQTLFRGSATVVTPVITPNRKSIDVAIRWR